MLVKKVALAINDYSMQDIYKGCILGFSCGADSSALLHFLKDRCENLLCVHINHMIRGAEADNDEAMAKATCEKYGVKFVSYKIDIPSLAKERKQGLEECSRNERYRIFNELLENNKEYKCIVTAHNLDDNAETVLFNLARGTGPRGLCGIKMVQGNIMRPLLYVTKNEIIEYCVANNIEYVQDSTNDDTQYTRNHIRHNVVPQLLKVNPDFKDAILRLGNILTSDEEYFNIQIDNIIKENNIVDSIDIELLRSLDYSIASRLLKRVLGGSLDYTATNACIGLAKNGGAGDLVNLPGGISFKLEHGYAHFISTAELCCEDFYLDLTSEINVLESQDMIIAVNSSQSFDEYEKIYEIKLNSERISAPLYARSKRDGDIIRSGKMTKKLKKLFVDNHIPSHQRGKIPLICMNNEIISVPSIATKDGFVGKDFIINIYRRRK